MQIKTLAEILAESDADSASSSISERKKKTKTSDSNSQYKAKSKIENSSATSTPYQKPSTDSSFQSAKSKPNKKQKRKNRFHPASNFIAEPNDTPVYKPPEAQSIKEMLAEVKQDSYGSQNDDGTIDTNPKLDYLSATARTSQLTSTEVAQQTDNLPSALKAYLRTPEQKQAELDAIKAESRLRWLAFYYLSRREYGKAELKQKLIDKEQDPDRIDALLDEFADKGYQSDYRTTLILIRESIRKGRGRGRIKQEFYKKKIAMPSNIDELIDMANTESDEFSEFVDEDADSLIEGVDWLKLAVTARTKKYGDHIPTEQKDKAKQLRFLQYRGFKSDICFQALSYSLETLDERF